VTRPLDQSIRNLQGLSTTYICKRCLNFSQIGQ